MIFSSKLDQPSYIVSVVRDSDEEVRVAKKMNPHNWLVYANRASGLRKIHVITNRDEAHKDNF